MHALSTLPNMASTRTFALLLFLFVLYYVVKGGTLPLVGYRVPLKVFIVGQQGMLSARPELINREVEFLNARFEKTVQFSRSSTVILDQQDVKSCGAGGEKVNPEDYFIIRNAANALYQLAKCFGDERAINVFVVKNLHQPSGHSSTGIAMVNQPLGQSLPASVILSADRLVAGGVTIAHEVGHVMGLPHTALDAGPSDRAPSGAITTVEWHYQEACGEIYSYPLFMMAAPWHKEDNPLHGVWPGRNNPMADENILSLKHSNFFGGSYRAPFQALIQCWRRKSSLRAGEDAPMPSYMID